MKLFVQVQIHSMELDVILFFIGHYYILYFLGFGIIQFLVGKKFTYFLFGCCGQLLQTLCHVGQRLLESRHHMSL